MRAGHDHIEGLGQKIMLYFLSIGDAPGTYFVASTWIPDFCRSRLKELRKHVNKHLIAFMPALKD